MNVIPIGSKQIAFVRYDDQSSQMHIQFHTGQTYTCEMNSEEYQNLLHSPNRYDMVIRMTSDTIRSKPNIQIS